MLGQGEGWFEIYSASWREPLLGPRPLLWGPGSPTITPRRKRKEEKQQAQWGSCFHFEKAIYLCL